MAHPEQDCERCFRAAVGVVHSLPKNGVYRPSHEVMLRFYSFYKQATCGPCAGPRPGFWDPIGRYKWDAWKRLGGMSREGAMREYVEEMKRVAQEVIDTVPMNEKTASMFHHFQPLYHVIHDMPKPPDTLLQQTGGELEGSMREEWSGESEPQGKGPVWGVSGQPDGGAEFNQEGNHVTSDSESEVFCDSMEQLDPDKQGEPQSDSSASEIQSPLNPVAAATQAGAGQGGERAGPGGEGAGRGEGEPMRKKGALRDGRQSHRSERWPLLVAACSLWTLPPLPPALALPGSVADSPPPTRAQEGAASCMRGEPSPAQPSPAQPNPTQPSPAQI